MGPIKGARRIQGEMAFVLFQPQEQLAIEGLAQRFHMLQIAIAGA